MPVRICNLRILKSKKARENLRILKYKKARARRVILVSLEQAEEK